MERLSSAHKPLLPFLSPWETTAPASSTVALERLVKDKEEREALVKHLLEQHRSSKPQGSRLEEGHASSIIPHHSNNEESRANLGASITRGKSSFELVLLDRETPPALFKLPQPCSLFLRELRKPLLPTN